ncbi:MAG: rhomboid family intramembrane serine protease [Elainellaceae cyanobacterium]
MNPTPIDPLSHPIAFLTVYLAADNFDLEEQVRTIVNLIAVAWAIHIVNWGFGRGALNWVFGIRSRQLSGIIGIVTAHFLHSVRRDDTPNKNSHIVGNTIGFLFLGFLVAIQGLKLFYVVSIIAALISGLGTWLFGRDDAPHVGASGVLFGYIGFLIIYGIVSRNLFAFLAGAAGLFIFQTNFIGVVGILPGQAGMSWEGHLFGFIGGVFAAYLIGYAMLNYIPG